jgi:cyclopropane-fatty-acyl-phospholipid synthase
MLFSLLTMILRPVLRKGGLRLVSPNGTVVAFGDASETSPRVRIVDHASIRRLCRNPALALGELFVEGRLLLEQGSIYDLLSIISENLASNRPALLQLIEPVSLALQKLQTRSNTILRAKRNVAHHYDLDDRLYSLFLDADKQYSCAYFDGSACTIDEAQLAKKRHIAAKLLLRPGNRVLDIGSGWGGLALYLAECCSADVTGITLSEPQLASSKLRARERGLDTATHFLLEDYRKVRGSFDRIVSVGMFEHVGRKHFGPFFESISRLLADDGVMLLHTIGRSNGPSPTDPWIEKYIFPGGYLPALSEMLPCIENAGLIVTDVEILRLHYAETLRLWRTRFLSRRPEAMKLYGEQFCRMWEYYLAAAECGFRYGGLVVFQVQLAKRQNVVPLTRDYIAAYEASLRERERQLAFPTSSAAE